MIPLWTIFKDNSTIIKLAMGGVATLWLLAISLIVSLFIMQGCQQPVVAEPPQSPAGLPAIHLEPGSGTIDSWLVISGQGWGPDQQVLIYITGPDQTEISGYALNSASTNAEGQFQISAVIPTDVLWQVPGPVKVIARTVDGKFSTFAYFMITGSIPPLTDTPAAIPANPTATATQVSMIPAATDTPEPGTPMILANTAINIRGGPGTDYPILGLLQTGQNAEVTGISPDQGWWQIKFSGVSNGRGWVATKYVMAGNTANVPVVQPPSRPANPPTSTPAPTSTPIVISDWRAEYFNNLSLSGNPNLMRNDSAIQFDWGYGAPAAEVGADNFSVRWTRSMYFAGGNYRFTATVDDGVRLWVDGILLIDQWHDSAPTAYTADLYLTEGSHPLRVEYFEHTGSALIQLRWERIETYTDWKGEYFNNPNLNGTPILVRNDAAVRFGWGPGSPGIGVPADNFSARWTRNLHLSAGNYRFRLLVDDGARLWIDGQLVMDQWRTGEPKTFTTDLYLSDSNHSLRLEYFDYRYDAQVHFSWERVDGFSDWKAEYFDNRNLRGSPILVRNEGAIDYQWGGGAPAGVPADNFSARWTRQFDFQAGTYRFKVRADDGVRVWLDEVLLIDQWQNGRARWTEADYSLNAGRHSLKIEYYEHSGDAEIEFQWEKKPEPANQAPQAIPGGPYTVNEGSSITLDGRASKDPDGSLVKFEWDLTYDGQTFTSETFDAVTDARYPDGPAIIIIALRVTDNKGATHLATAQVLVQNVSPTVEAGGPYSGQTGANIAFAGTATDPGTIDQTGLKYHWNFGDGSEGNGSLAGHSYEQAGTYTVTLTVTDKDGGVGRDTAVVQVIKVPQPPQAVLEGPTTGKIGQPLAFDGSESFDIDGQISHYSWNFGDGMMADGPQVTHTYLAEGGYRVTLTVTDDDNLTTSISQLVQIAPPIQVNLSPTAIISSPTIAQISQTITFDGSRSFDSDGQIVSYFWEFGDGQKARGPQVDHTYKAEGDYEVWLTVADDGGLTATVFQIIRVIPPMQVNPPPALPL